MSCVTRFPEDLMVHQLVCSLRLLVTNFDLNVLSIHISKPVGLRGRSFRRASLFTQIKFSFTWMDSSKSLWFTANTASFTRGDKASRKKMTTIPMQVAADNNYRRDIIHLCRQGDGKPMPNSGLPYFVHFGTNTIGDGMYSSIHLLRVKLKAASDL